MSARAAAAKLVVQQSAHALEIMSIVTSDCLAMFSVSPVQYHVDPTPIVSAASVARRQTTWAREVSPCLVARHARRSPEIETTAAGPTAYQNSRS